VDWVPFFVAPPVGAATAKVALLIPTFSYLAYANTQVMQASALAQPVIGIITTLSDHDLELGEFSKEYGLSHYDVHCDGRGVMYSSWRRPIFNMRPDHRHEYGSIWQFPADLHLVDWLEAKGVEYDIITDHDLMTEGSDVLGHYNLVMTGTHPEYYSGNMLDAWEDYIGGGGRGMYMGGNGFYWITTPHPEKPWVVEVRRGESGDQAWRGKPGELHHSTTGERGGIWRHRARAPQKIWGTGYGSHGLDVSTYYHQMPDAADPRLAWIMENVAKDEKIGDFGLVNGGAAGLEMDHIDYALGSPPNTMLIGASIGHSANAMLVPEDIYFAHPGTNGEEDPLVRGDLVFASSTNGGAVFSVSSMAWCGSLSHNGYNNNVSTITLNVINRFSTDGPVEEVV
jgi:N,N-dimethylformamidase